jgi:hypothetical protein
MDRNRLREVIQNDMIEWQIHALERMMKRGISREIVKQVLLEGEIIEDYPADKPSPQHYFWGGSKENHSM